MDTQGAVGQKLPNMVTAADMVPLVGKNVGQLLGGDMGGQIDSGPEYSQNKGGINIVGPIDALFQRHRPHQLFPEPEILPQAGKPQDSHPGKPERRDKGCPVNGLVFPGGPDWDFPVCEGFGKSGNIPGKKGNHRRSRSGHPGLRLQHLQKRDRGAEGQRAQKPEQHHGPEGVGKNLRKTL